MPSKREQAQMSLEDLANVYGIVDDAELSGGLDPDLAKTPNQFYQEMVELIAKGWSLVLDNNLKDHQLAKLLFPHTNVEHLLGAYNDAYKPMAEAKSRFRYLHNNSTPVAVGMYSQELEQQLNKYVNPDSDQLTMAESRQSLNHSIPDKRAEFLNVFANQLNRVCQLEGNLDQMDPHAKALLLLGMFDPVLVKADAQKIEDSRAKPDTYFHIETSNSPIIQLFSVVLHQHPLSERSDLQSKVAELTQRQSDISPEEFTTFLTKELTYSFNSFRPQNPSIEDYLQDRHPSNLVHWQEEIKDLILLVADYQETVQKDHQALIQTKQSPETGKAQKKDKKLTLRQRFALWRYRLLAGE